MAWKVGFLPVSSHLDHQSLRLRSQNKPHYWSQVMVKKNPDFRFNRKRKSGKTEFFEVHIERALITHLITALFVIFPTFFSHMRARAAEDFHDIMNLAITAFEGTWNNSYWWKTIQLLKVWKKGQSIKAFGETWKNSYRWKTIQLPQSLKRSTVNQSIGRQVK